MKTHHLFPLLVLSIFICFDLFAVLELFLHRTFNRKKRGGIGGFQLKHCFCLGRDEV